MNADQLKSQVTKIVGTAGSLLKVALMSGKVSPAGNSKERELVIMGNGPSLRTTLDSDRQLLEGRDLLAVNYAANTPEFKELRPAHYVLADGLFFSENTDRNTVRLWEVLSLTDWPMILWVPRKFQSIVRKRLCGNTHISLKFFNLTPIEGIDSISHWLMNLGLGMPRPRNVMIPSIMNAIREGYKKIYLAGADHTWTQTLSVDDENFVVSIQPHFYKDNEEEHSRVRSVYAGLHLHDVLGSMTIAFRSYWDIVRYASRKGVEIINATPGSMIDAFPRLKTSRCISATGTTESEQS